MFREVLIKLAGVALLLLGIGLLAFGFLLEHKFMEATGFISGIMGGALLYYAWVTSMGQPVGEEPEEIKPLTK